MRRKLRDHLDWAARFATWVREDPDFELLAPVPVQTINFRRHPRGLDDEEALNRLNDGLVKAINADGRIYISQTKLGGRVTAHLSIGQTNTTLEDVERAWDIIREKAEEAG